MPSLTLTCPPIPKGGGFSFVSQKVAPIFSKGIKGPHYVETGPVECNPSCPFMAVTLQGVLMFEAAVTSFAVRVSIIDISSGCKFAPASAVSGPAALINCQTGWLTSPFQNMIPEIPTIEGPVFEWDAGRCVTPATFVFTEPQLLKRTNLGLFIELVSRDDANDDTSPRNLNFPGEQGCFPGTQQITKGCIKRFGWTFLSLHGPVVGKHSLQMFKYLFRAPEESRSDIIAEATEAAYATNFHVPLGVYEFGAEFRHFVKASVSFEITELPQLPLIAENNETTGQHLNQQSPNHPTSTHSSKPPMAPRSSVAQRNSIGAVYSSLIGEEDSEKQDHLIDYAIGGFPRAVRCLPKEEVFSVLTENDGITKIVFSPNGELIAYACQPGHSKWASVVVVDAKKGAVKHQVQKAHQGKIHDMMFTTDDVFVTCGSDGLAKAWQLPQNFVDQPPLSSSGQIMSNGLNVELVGTFLHASSVSSICLCENSFLIATVPTSGLWVWKFQIGNSHLVHPNPLALIPETPEYGNFLCVKDFTPISHHTGEPTPRRSFAGTALAAYAVSEPTAATATVTESSNNELQQNQSSSSRPVSRSTPSQGTAVLVSTTKGTFLRMALDSLAITNVFEFHDLFGVSIHAFEVVTETLKVGVVTSAAITASALLLVFSKDSVVRTLAVPHWNINTSLHSDAEIVHLRYLMDYRGASLTRSSSRGSLSPDGRYVICGSDCGRLFLWDSGSGRLISPAAVVESSATGGQAIGMQGSPAYEVTLPYGISEAVWSKTHRILAVGSCSEGFDSHTSASSPLVVLGVKNEEGSLKNTPRGTGALGNMGIAHNSGRQESTSSHRDSSRHGSRTPNRSRSPFPQSPALDRNFKYEPGDILGEIKASVRKSMIASGSLRQ